MIKKLPNQTLLDYILSNYQNLDGIDSFINVNDITDIQSYDNTDVFNDTDNVPNRDVATTYNLNTVTPSNAVSKDVSTKTDKIKYTPQRKQRKQNLLDFVITNYGNLDRIDDFLDINNFNNITRFKSVSLNTVFNVSNKPTNTPLINDFKSRKYYVTTADHIVVPPQGDFNQDYNDDYFNKI